MDFWVRKEDDPQNVAVMSKQSEQACVLAV